MAGEEVLASVLSCVAVSLLPDDLTKLGLGLCKRLLSADFSVFLKIQKKKVVYIITNKKLKVLYGSRCTSRASQTAWVKTLHAARQLTEKNPLHLSDIKRHAIML